MKLTARQAWNALALYGDPAQAGLQAPGPKRRNAKPEQEVVNAVMAALRTHNKVAWVVRMNSGAYKTPDGRFIRFGFEGCPDIWGQMRTGALLCVECKSATGKPTEAQAAVLERVRANGGHAGVARSIEDALEIVEGSQ